MLASIVSSIVFVFKMCKQSQANFRFVDPNLGVVPLEGGNGGLCGERLHERLDQLAARRLAVLRSERSQQRVKVEIALELLDRKCGIAEQRGELRGIVVALGNAQLAKQIGEPLDLLQAGEC